MDAVVGLIEIEDCGDTPLHDCDPATDITLDGLLARLAGRVNRATSEPAPRTRNRIQQALVQTVQLPADLHHLAADLDAQTTLLVARIATAKSH